MQYWLINDSGYLANTVEWDGVSPFPIPDGYNLQLASGPPPALSPQQFATYKKKKLAAIDARTAMLCASGLPFTLSVGGTKVFSLSQAMRGTWLGLFLAAPNLTYPFANVVTVSGPSATFSNAAEVQAWYQAGLTAIENIELPGNALKDAVNAATTQAQVDAVTDSRTLPAGVTVVVPPPPG